MLRLLVTAFILNLLLVAPLWWRYGDIGTPLIAWEAWVIAPVMLLLAPGVLRHWLAIFVVVYVALTIGINLSDAATHAAFGRSFNLYLDVPLARSIYHLLAGNVGQLATVFLMALGAVVLVGMVWVLVRLLLPATRVLHQKHQSAMAVVLLSIAVVFALLEANGHRFIPKSALPMVNTTRFQSQQVVTTHRARLTFAEQLAIAPLDVQPLPGLAGRNVLLTFIESYGVSALNDPRYNPPLLATLEEMQHRLADRDLYVVSGLLEAPIRGGQSWLAHATTLSGRWIDNQLWYRLMLNSGHSTLVDDFRATGLHTLSVMPAITFAWPEGEAYGFDDIAVAKDIAYAGPPLNWVTMPDQFTLDYTQRHLLSNTPFFAQLALISSHAPWTPILPVLENWGLVGDGSIYAPWENASTRPEVLWQDLERIRDHFSWSVDYSVKVTGRWAERVVDEQTLLIILGDHQPAPLITGDNASAAVPVHIISGDPELLAPFRARGFIDGTLPALESADNASKMSQLRHWLQEDFGAEGLPTRTTP